ncbi:hypothetical protein AAC387_Pa04g1624 [Persea americana]
MQTSLVSSVRTFSSLDAFFSPSLATKINKSALSSSPRLVWAGVASSPIFASSPSSVTYLAANPLTKVAAWKDSDGDWYETGLHIFSKLSTFTLIAIWDF